MSLSINNSALLSNASQITLNRSMLQKLVRLALIIGASKSSGSGQLSSLLGNTQLGNTGLPNTTMNNPMLGDVGTSEYPLPPSNQVSNQTTLDEATTETLNAASYLPAPEVQPLLMGLKIARWSAANPSPLNSPAFSASLNGVLGSDPLVDPLLNNPNYVA